MGIENSLTAALVRKLGTEAGKLLGPTLTDLPVTPVAQLVQHLQGTNVSDALFPFARFGCVHAARVSFAWALATKNSPKGRSTLLNLVGYLTMAWGGSTLASLLLSTPPPWLLSPGPWAVYVTAYLLLISTSMSRYAVDTCPSFLLNILLAGLDGMLRGTGSCAIASAAAAKGLPAWSGVILAPIATCGGGWLAQLMGMADGVPRAPSVLQGGVLGTLDVWGAMATAAIYLALTGQPGPWAEHFKHFRNADEKNIDAGAARAIAIIFFACLFTARVTTQALLKPGQVRQSVKKAETKAAKVMKQAEEKLVKVSAESNAVEAQVVKSPAAAASPAKKRKNKKKAAAAH